MRRKRDSLCVMRFHAKTLTPVCGALSIARQLLPRQIPTARLALSLPAQGMHDPRVDLLGRDGASTDSGERVADGDRAEAVESLGQVGHRLPSTAPRGDHFHARENIEGREE